LIVSRARKGIGHSATARNGWRRARGYRREAKSIAQREKTKAKVKVEVKAELKLTSLRSRLKEDLCCCVPFENSGEHAARSLPAGRQG
jgi:hypothetical protein